jgi:hypothetical protein
MADQQQGQAVYGLVGEQPQQQQPAAGQPRQPAAQVGPYRIAADDITNPYAMTWAAYSNRLKRYLDATYPLRAPAPARAPAAQAPAAAAEAGGRGDTIAAIKGALKLATSPLKTVNPAFSNNRINNLVDNAASAVPALADGAVFVTENFANSILLHLNNLARQNANKGTAQALAVAIPILRANIGV